MSGLLYDLQFVKIRVMSANKQSLVTVDAMHRFFNRSVIVFISKNTESINRVNQEKENRRGKSKYQSEEQFLLYDNTLLQNFPMFGRFRS